MNAIKTVTVIGANGTMGRNVAAIYASFGDARVYMVCRDMEKAEKAARLAVKSVRADSIRSKLIPVTYDDMDGCVAESDLIVEHVAENLELKIRVMEQVARSMRRSAIACSGSSGLSITRLAECFDEQTRGRFFGVHMFNPPYSLPLCELIPTAYSDMALYRELESYLSNTLRRTVVEVKDSPAFLANRIGFQFINEALQCAQRYQDSGGIDYIDAILGSYTGRSMAPLVTSDFVGLDVHQAIVDNLHENTADYANATFAFPEFAKRLVHDGALGRKTGGGLYRLVRYDDGFKRMTTYDIASQTYRDQMQYVFPFQEKMLYNLQKGSYRSAMQALVENHSQEAELALRFLLQYVMYALMAAEQVGNHVHAADDAMAAGFHWCPPLAVRDALSAVCDFGALVNERLTMPGDLVNHLLALAKPSKYDFRSYFKAKR